MTFIKLNSAVKEGKHWFFSASKIVYFTEHTTETEPKYSGTLLNFQCPRASDDKYGWRAIFVKETPQQILEMIRPSASP